MAILQGISGLQIGDGQGGKVALSLQTRVLRILADNVLSYATATANNPSSVKAGTASYYVPELIQTEDYGDGSTAPQKPNAGLVSFNLDSRGVAKYDIETFDIERLNEADYILGQIATGLAMSIQATLNASFFNYLATQFKGNLSTQKIELEKVVDADPTMTPEQARKDLLTLEYKYNEINQTFDKNKLGVAKADIMCILAPVVDTGLRNAFWNQPGSIGNFVISKTLSGTQLGNIKYTVDPMLNKSITAGSSFSKDKEFDFSKIYGFMFHNEAIAMPINLNTIMQTVDPNTGNPRFIAKFQYGIGIIRPKLCFIILKQGQALIRSKEK